MNESVVGVADTTGTPEIAKVTFTVTALPPLGVIVRVAAYGVEDAARPLGLAVTVSVYGVVAKLTLVVSQLAELLTVKEIGAEPEPAFAIVKVWEAGVLPPIA